MDGNRHDELERRITQLVVAESELRSNKRLWCIDLYLNNTTKGQLLIENMHLMEDKIDLLKENIALRLIIDTFLGTP